MLNSSAPTSTPPTGGTGTDLASDPLLHELRRGERAAFVRYYELYRAPVYGLVSRLLHDGEDAVTAVEEVFTTAYRRILLHDDGIDLQERTYRAALDVCRERLGEREADRGAPGGYDVLGRDAEGRLRGTAPNAATGADRRESSDLGRRFAQALMMLPFSHRAVLLLHDVNGLRPAETATVFGVTEEAAGALLFRAREEFRSAFEEVSSGRRAANCRLAEQTAAGAVGRSLSHDEVRRLDEHAGYCRHCRRTMKGWGVGAIGLALFLEDAPLPQALETTPVFGTAIAITGALGAVAGAGTLTRVLAQIGRTLTSRAAAYALAATCLAVSVGLAVHHSPGEQTFIVVPATAPSALRSVQPAASVVRPPSSRSNLAGATTARTESRSAVATSSRSVNGSAAAFVAHAGATEPTVTVVADAGRASDGGPPTVGQPDASSAKGGWTVTRQGDAKAGAEATKDGRVSTHLGHAESANRSHAEPSKTRHGKAAKHHATKATKHRAWQHHAKTATKHRAWQHHAKTATKHRAWQHHAKTATKHRAWQHHAKTATKHRAWQHHAKTATKHRAWQHHAKTATKHRAWQHHAKTATKHRAWQHHAKTATKHHAWQHHTHKKSKKNN